jgi:hypothetical protein
VVERDGHHLSVTLTGAGGETVHAILFDLLSITAGELMTAPDIARQRGRATGRRQDKGAKASSPGGRPAGQ